ncbi:MAG TPA: glycosyltransferase family 39 protein [Verrucomicrobiae bacterium]|nr:glycosyltransferase family 39 protein [Verrucomicrobiae bacterium]
MEDHKFTALSKRNIAFMFSLIFLFECTFAFGYEWSQYKKYGGYPYAIYPLARGASYITPPDDRTPCQDCCAYNFMASSLLEKHGFYNPSGQASAWYTPGYPIVLAILYGIFGYAFLPVLIFNALCLTLAYYFLFRLAWRLFDFGCALMCLVLLVCNLRAGYHIAYVLTDSLFFLFCAGTLYLTYLIWIGERRGWSTFAALGAAFGYGSLVRPVMLPLILLLAVILLVRGVGWRKVLTCVACAGLVFGLWVGRNYHVFGRFVISTSSDYWLVEEDRDAYRTLSFWEPYKLITYTIPPRDRFGEKAISRGENDLLFMESTSYLFREDYSDWCRRNFRFYLWICAWRLKALLSPFTAVMSFRNKVFSTALWAVTMVPGLAAGLFLYKRGFYWVMILTASGLLALPVLWTVDTQLRYQIPAQLILTVPAAWLLQQSWRLGKAHPPGPAQHVPS